MNKRKGILVCLPLFLAAGCDNTTFEDKTDLPVDAENNKIELRWETAAADVALRQMTVFLFNDRQSEPVITRFFDERELQAGKVDFFLPPDREGTEYELYGVANLDCSGVKGRYDLYNLQENQLGRYHAEDYATAVAAQEPEGGFIYTCRERVTFSDKPLRLSLGRTVARLEVTVEVSPGVEQMLGTPLYVDSLCVTGITTGMFLFDEPPAGANWRRGWLNQRTDARNKGLFYLYPSAPGEEMPVVNLWCSYAPAQLICYPLPLDGSVAGSGEQVILPNKRYRLLIRVEGAGAEDLSLKLEVDDWTVLNQDQEF